MTTVNYMRAILKNPNARTTGAEDVEATTQNIFQALWSHPAGKAAIIIALGTLSLGGLGLLYRLLAWVKEGYSMYLNAGSSN